MVAGVAEHQAVALAVILTGLTVAEDDKGIVLMPGIAPLRRNRADSVGDRRTFRLTLHGVAAVKVDTVPGAEGQVEAGRSRLPKADGLLPAVSDPDRPGDDVTVGEDPVQELRLQPRGRILKKHREGLGLPVFPGEGARKAFQRKGALPDLMPRIAKIHAEDAVLAFRENARQAEVGPVGAAVLLRHRVQRKAA